MKVKINVRILLNIFIFVRDEETMFSKLKIPSEMEVTPRYTLHYAARADIWKKSYHEMFNFENWFLCQFSSNTQFSFGGGYLDTPKIGKRKKRIYKYQFQGV